MIDAAVRNNAEWCDRVCRSHGVVTGWSDDYWTTRSRSLAGYPDAVTLRPGAGPLPGVIDAGPGASVKDSYAELDLTPAGFAVLFEAHWLHREPARPRPVPDWTVVQTGSELSRWATAHGGGDTLRADLLADPTIRILARWVGDRLAGGAVANRTGDVVGISNVFGPADDWADLPAVVAGSFPDLPLVGYERGDDLAAARAAGFAATGRLRVWARA